MNKLQPRIHENGMDYVSSAKRDVETLKAAFGDY